VITDPGQGFGCPVEGQRVDVVSESPLPPSHLIVSFYMEAGRDGGTGDEHRG
jgi:hypothetical protein